jgi:hypothetical protein
MPVRLHRIVRSLEHVPPVLHSWGAFHGDSQITNTASPWHSLIADWRAGQLRDPGALKRNYTVHVVALSGLTAGTRYHYKARPRCPPPSTALARLNAPAS